MKIGGWEVPTPHQAIFHPGATAKSAYGGLSNYGANPTQFAVSGGTAPLVGMGTLAMGGGTFEEWNRDRMKHWGEDPGEAYKNFLMATEPSVRLTGGFDKLTGGTGSYNSTAQNPYVHGIGGAVLGAWNPWAGAAAPFVAQGISATGRGDGQDQQRAGTWAGMGALAGGVGRMGYNAGSNWLNNAGSSTTTSSVTGGTVPVEGPPNELGQYPTYTWDSTAVGGQSIGEPAYADVAGDYSGQSMATSQPTEIVSPVGTSQPSSQTIPTQDEIGRARQDAEFPRAARSAPAGGTTMNGMGSARSYAMPAMLAKAGLGFWQNYQQQKAVEDELKDRERIRNMQLAAMNDPLSVPGLRERRRLGQKAFDARYRAQYGGAGGGAYDKGMARYLDSVTSQGVGDYVNTLGGIGAQTQPAMMINAQAGGTPSGALAGAGASALTDMALMQWWQSQMGG